MWLAVKNHIKRAGREVGVNVIVKVSKNKVTGKQRQIEFPIYFDYGIDDYLSCINFLLEEKVWTKTGGKINTRGLISKELNEDDLIDEIIEKRKYNNLIEIVANRWALIEKKIATKRKPKYEEE